MLRAKKYLAIILFFFLALPVAVFSYTYGPNNWSIKVDPNEANSTIVINGVTYQIKNTNAIGASIFIPLKTTAESDSFLASPIGTTVTEVGGGGCNATGGTITNVGGYRIHTFTTSGTFAPTANCSAEVLVVAGGGEGGSGGSGWTASGGGGGAGGVLHTNSLVIAAGSHAVTVGTGGANQGIRNSKPAANGGNSSFLSLTAIGGGGGRQEGTSAGNGGSGGGDRSAWSGGAYGSGTAGQGNNGGPGGEYYGAGGGGGAGGAGGAGGQYAGGAGGAGLYFSTSGSSVAYGGGGGGGTPYGAGAGGVGGGGAGQGVAGTPNTGGGGGGIGQIDTVSGAGGSGIVIIRYSTTEIAYPSCKAILDGGASTGNGLYLIDPDGPGGLSSFTTYCDMTGGGWTLVLLNSPYTQHPTPTWANAINANNITGTQSTNLDGAYDQLVGLGYWNSMGTGLRVEVGSSAASISHRAYYNYSLNSSNYYSLSLSNEQITTGGTAPGLRVYHAGNGFGFSTYDGDHDAYSGNCSTVYTNTPWWYGACWDGNFWGGGTSGGHQNKPFWSGSDSDYYNWGAIWVGPAIPSCGTCTYFNGSSCANSSSGTSCSSTSCSSNNSYYVSGEASPTGTNYTYYRSYSDATVYCNGSGTCNNYSCTSYSDSLIASCGTCQYASGDASGCTNYANGTVCGANSTCDGAGSCVETATPSSSACNATGGTVTEVGGYRIHTFASDGTFTPGNNCDAEVLVVGGGGGGNIGCNGCARGGGGGGAGGLIYTSYSVTGAVSVTVGGGGGTGGAGGNSVFGTLTAYGGGAGGNQGPGNSGGSGGGAGQYCSALSGGSGTSGQGFNGGSLPCRPSTQAPGQNCCYDGGPGAGGGGAGGEGAESVAGLGATYDISGSDVTYATGGLAGTYCGGQTNGPSGAANTGDGGGGAGGCASGATAGSGGSGVVIVRYPLGGGGSSKIKVLSVYPCGCTLDTVINNDGQSNFTNTCMSSTDFNNGAYGSAASLLSNYDVVMTDGTDCGFSFTQTAQNDLAAYVNSGGGLVLSHDMFIDGKNPTLLSVEGLSVIGGCCPANGLSKLADGAITNSPYVLPSTLSSVQGTHTSGESPNAGATEWYGGGGSTDHYLTSYNYGSGRAAFIQYGHSAYQCGCAGLSGAPSAGSDESKAIINALTWAANVVSGPTYSSCKAILDAEASTGNGLYTIDPDGAGGANSFQVYCEMTIDGGGWTVLISHPIAPTTQNPLDDYGSVSASGAYSIWSKNSTISYNQILYKPTYDANMWAIANPTTKVFKYADSGGAVSSYTATGGVSLSTGNPYHSGCTGGACCSGCSPNGCYGLQLDEEPINWCSWEGSQFGLSGGDDRGCHYDSWDYRWRYTSGSPYSSQCPTANPYQSGYALIGIREPGTTTYALTYTAGANCSISGTNPQTVEAGLDGTAVTVTPDSGYAFTSWSDSSTANPRTDTAVAADISVTATCTALPPATLYCDEDGDGFYADTAVSVCPSGRQQAIAGSDSNDNCYNTTNFTSRPNGADEDCDGQIDEDVIFAMYEYRKADCISGCGTMDQFCASTSCGNQPANYYGWAINPADPPRSCSCICATGDCWVHTYR